MFLFLIFAIDWLIDNIVFLWYNYSKKSLGELKMKSECALIKDVVSLYKDNVLNSESMRFIDKHISKCDECNAYYKISSDNAFLEKFLRNRDSGNLIMKIKKYRKWQLIVFAVFAIMFFLLGLTWFGNNGLDKISGFIIFERPTAVIGVLLFIYSVWYNFNHTLYRMICGLFGIISLVFADIVTFLTVRTPGMLIIDFGFFVYSSPEFTQVDINSCFDDACIGFYIGIGLLSILGVLFVIFCNKGTND